MSFQPNSVRASPPALSFARCTYWLCIGVSAVGVERCCVHLATQHPSEVIQPPSDRKYIVRVLFEFEAPKRTPYATIITNLRYAEIYPGGDPARFSPPTNPDGKFYTDLPYSAFDTIAAIIRLSIAGMSIGHDLRPLCKITTTSDADIRARRALERPKINPYESILIVVNTVDKPTTYETIRPSM